MAEEAAASGLPEWIGHVATYLSAVGTGYVGGRIKDLVTDLNKALADINEATTLGERQLRLHAMGQTDQDGLAKVFTARSNLGDLIDGQFGTSHSGVIAALSMFTSALDVCDPGARVGLQLGQPADQKISELRNAQRSLRRAISGTRKGRLAKFIGRKAVAE